MSLQCAIAKLTKDRGYRYFRIDERARLSGGRSTARVTFYMTPPSGIPVVENIQDKNLTKMPNLMTAAINAEDFIETCSLIENRP